MEKQLVVFELENERFGVEISAVESIIKMPVITAVPNSPLFVEGVTNLRGKILPVMDLRRRFGLPAAGQTKNNRVVVVSLDGIEVGIIVDGVSEVLTVTDEMIEQPPAMVTTIDSAFIIGIAKIDDGLVILLDLKKVLSIQVQTELANR